jgi:hypothetical protein
MMGLKILCRDLIPILILDHRTIGLVPNKLLSQSKADARRICLDYTVSGIKAIHEAGPAKPFRFVYVSGAPISRDPNKWQPFMGDYFRLRVRLDSPFFPIAFLLKILQKVFPSYLTMESNRERLREP